MTHRPLKLLDFSKDTSSVAEPQAEQLDQKAAAYAEGFQAGIQRAQDAVEKQSLALNQSLEEALHDIAIQQAEQRQAVEIEMLRLVGATFETALPPLLARHYGEVVMAQIRTILDTADYPEITVEVSDAHFADLAPLLPDGLPCKVADDLADAQVRLRAGTEQYRIDLDAFTQSLRLALDLEEAQGADRLTWNGATQ